MGAHKEIVSFVFAGEKASILLSSAIQTLQPFLLSERLVTLEGYSKNCLEQAPFHTSVSVYDPPATTYDWIRVLIKAYQKPTPLCALKREAGRISGDCQTTSCSSEGLMPDAQPAHTRTRLPNTRVSHAHGLREKDNPEYVRRSLTSRQGVWIQSTKPWHGHAYDVKPREGARGRLWEMTGYTTSS